MSTTETATPIGKRRKRATRESAAPKPPGVELEGDAPLDPADADLYGDGEDPGLVELDASGRPVGARGAKATDVHGDPEATTRSSKGDVTEDVLKALHHSDRAVITTDMAMQNRRIYDAPAPFPDRPTPMTPTAPHVDGQLAGGVTGNDPRTRDELRQPGVDAMQLVAASDDVDVAFGLKARERRASAVFDWCVDSIGHRHHFSRHYYTAGVLVDRFGAANEEVRREIASKCRQIAAYNAAVEPTQRLGYLAMVVGAPFDYERIARALRREIVDQLLDLRPYDGPLGPNGGGRIIDMSSQALPENWT